MANVVIAKSIRDCRVGEYVTIDMLGLRDFERNRIDESVYRSEPSPVGNCRSNMFFKRQPVQDVFGNTMELFVRYE